MDLLNKLGMHAGATPTIFKKAEMLRTKMTIAEHRLWNYLRTKPWGIKFRRQHPFGIYVLDFYCHSRRISIEVDGDSHDLPQQKLYDDERTNYIKDLGVTELRFENDEVLNDFTAVERKIMNTLQSKSL